MLFDWKCAVTNAILTVLVYLLIVRLMGMESGRTMAESVQWYKSMEVLLLVSAFVAFNVNTALFTGCKA
jgi:hypothetical protein